MDPALDLARRRLLEAVGRAARQAGRDPASVEIVAVTKTVSAERIRAALEAGFRTFGENRVQEALAKIGTLPGAAWHLIGPLQANKARRAAAAFAVIETIDSVELAARLDRLVPEVRDAPLPVLLQVNVDADPAKSGFTPAEMRASVGPILDLPNLEVRGLMTVGRLVADAELARPTFAALRRLSEALRHDEPRLGLDLSMGMSDDFEVAVEEGATIVRLGRALFGERPPSGADAGDSAVAGAADAPTDEPRRG